MYTNEKVPSMTKECAMRKADASQRGNTCWFSSVLTSIANSNTVRENTLSKKKKNSSIFERMNPVKSDIATDILNYAGQEKYEQIIHLALTEILGVDACPVKPKDGHSSLEFMKKLLNVLDIENVVIQTHIVPKTPFHTIDTKHCSMTTFDIQNYIDEQVPSRLWAHDITSGICAIQVLAPTSKCAKIVGLVDKIIIGKHEKYELRLRNMLVSAHGHVITIGTCDKPNEWYIYDNEFAGRGSPLRKFESFSFQSVMDLMFNFPHTYFSPKTGPITLNPLFLNGPQSATTFMFDIRRIKE